MSALPYILIIDDDEAVALGLRGLLTQAGYEVEVATSGADGLEAVDRSPVDVVICDIRMPGIDGLSVLDRLHSAVPGLPVVMLTAHGTIALAVDAMRRGAHDFLTKPISRDALMFSMKKAISVATRAQDRPPDSRRGMGLSSTDPAMEAVERRIAKAAESASTVLIRGETGVGKEVIAKRIHQLSARRDGAFVAINCAAIPETLLESELFGYEPGAFTGANTAKPGRFELASGGTLFLDEIGDMPASTQAKLLRALQEKTIERLGSTSALAVDLRVVAATHQPLEQLVATGRFRQDLFFRLNVVDIFVPPLRERPVDIATFARGFLAEFCREQGKQLSLSNTAIDALKDYSWPGNVRQLRNTIERLVVFEEDTVGASAIGLHLGIKARDSHNHLDETSLSHSRDRAERSAVLEALDRAGNNKTKAARLLGVSRRTLYNKLEALGLLETHTKR